MTRTPEQIQCRHRFGKTRMHRILDQDGGKRVIYMRVCLVCGMLERVNNLLKDGRHEPR